MVNDNKWREKINCVDEIKRELKFMNEIKWYGGLLSENWNDINLRGIDQMANNANWMGHRKCVLTYKLKTNHKSQVINE